MVALTLPDGSVRRYDGPVSGAQLAADIGAAGDDLGDPVEAATVRGQGVRRGFAGAAAGHELREPRREGREPVSGYNEPRSADSQCCGRIVMATCSP